MAIDIKDPEFITALNEAVTAQVSGLKSKNDELLEKLAKSKLPDADLKELQEFRKSQEKADENKAKAAGEFDKLREQMVTKHSEELKNAAGREMKMKASLDTHLIKAAAVSAIASAKGSTTLLLPHVKNQLRVVENNGEFVARVVDNSGTVRIGDTKGTPMSIDQLVADMKADDIFASAFEGTGAGGGGAKGGNGVKANGKTIPRADFEKLNPMERTTFMKEGGALIDT